LQLSERRLWLVLLFLGLFLILAGCAEQDQEAPTSTASVPDTHTASPLPTATTATMTEPSPTAVEPTAAPEVVPTSDPTLGTVQGTLLVDGQPPDQDTLYLAEVVASGEGIGVAALDPARAPRAHPDAAGDFTFYNVPPGSYSLSILSPVGPVLIRTEDDTEITVEVEAGETSDLGVIDVPSFE
jgi:hypothetical protein